MLISSSMQVSSARYSAKDRVEHRSQKMRKHATRILSRNPGSVSFKHKVEFDSIKERLNEFKKNN